MWFWHENIKNQLHISDAYRLLLNLLNIIQEPVNKSYQKLSWPDLNTNLLRFCNICLNNKIGWMQRANFGSMVWKSNWSRSLTSLRLSETPGTVAYQAPQGTVHGVFQARVLEWVAISFSMGSSQPRDQTWVSRIAGRRFTIWATSEVHKVLY